MKPNETTHKIYETVQIRYETDPVPFAGYRKRDITGFVRFSRLTRWFRGWFRRSTKPSRNRHETVHETITKPSVLKFYGGGGGEKNKKKYKVNFLQVIKGRSRAIMGDNVSKSTLK